MKFIVQLILGWFLAWFLIGVFLGLGIRASNAEPLAARPFKHTVVREAHAVWGLSAPIAVFGGQIEQESGWRPEVCSRFACGLTQFTDDTADWISKMPGLEHKNVFNPDWAIRAMVVYDKWLYDQFEDAAGDKDRWAFTLSGYNGGVGNVFREQASCGPPCDERKWFGNVEHSRRRSPANFRENRGYVETILGRRQQNYATWGRQVL